MTVMKGITIKLPDPTLRQLKQEARATGRSVEALVRERVEAPRELLLAAGASVADAETSLHETLDVARRQETKALELRPAISVARLWRDRGRREDPRELLSAVLPFTASAER